MTPPHRDLVDGDWADAPATGPVLEDPATGAATGPAGVTGEARLERALAAAPARRGWPGSRTRAEPRCPWVRG
ncbi:hypothetical protein ACWEUT_43945, partial [Actinomadura geliboluensis]